MLSLHSLVFIVNSMHFTNRIQQIYKSSWINNNNKVELFSFSSDSCEITGWMPVHFYWKHILNLYWESQGLIWSSSSEPLRTEKVPHRVIIRDTNMGITCYCLTFPGKSVFIILYSCFINFFIRLSSVPPYTFLYCQE